MFGLIPPITNEFINIHIRKNAAATEAAVERIILDYMTSKQYIPCASEEDADGTVAIVCEADCDWISVYSDLLDFDGKKKYSEYLSPLSQKLGTDVLGISCFDSDFMYMNLVNKADKTNAWLRIGKPYGLGLMVISNVLAWRKKVSDFEAFSKAAKRKYVIAEDFLAEAERCLGLPTDRSYAPYEHLDDFELDKKAKYLYFKLQSELKKKASVKLRPHSSSAMPCADGKCDAFSAINTGDASKGLSVYFIGPYVENDEITFSDVCFVNYKNGAGSVVPFELSKIKLTDGRSAYYYHDPDFVIQPAVSDRLPPRKQLELESERSITVRFVPHGNPRKMLDITVVLVPDESLEGQCGWNVWQRFDSKAAFIEHYNESCDKFPGMGFEKLREEDFD